MTIRDISDADARTSIIRMTEELKSSLCCGTELPDDNYTYQEILRALLDAFEAGGKFFIKDMKTPFSVRLPENIKHYILYHPKSILSVGYTTKGVKVVTTITVWDGNRYFCKPYDKDLEKLFKEWLVLVGEINDNI